MKEDKSNDPYVSRAILDKIALTADLPKSAERSITENIEGMDCAKRVYVRGTYYGHSSSLDLSDICGDGTTVLIQLKPNRKSINNTRIEFNPGAFSIEARKHLRQVLRHIFGEHMILLLNNSKVTRLDVAVDIANLHINDVFPEARHHKRDRAVFKDQHFQTIYYGESLVIYDKKAEMEQKRKMSKYENLTRIEYRHKHLNCSISDLEECANSLAKSFQQVRLYNTTALVTNKRIPAVLVDACHWRGIDKATRIMSPSDADIFAREIKSARLHLLDCKQISTMLEKPIARTIKIFSDKQKATKV